MEIILASKSPRRKELLSKITENFSVMETDADESVPDNLSPAQKVEEISRIKSEAARKKAGDNCIIISADTAVFLDGVQYGKPKTKPDAQKMLRDFSGKKHSVITAFTVSKGEKSVTKHEETFVYFKNLSEKEIEEYVNTDEPYDKAGGYGIQGLAAKYIEKIDGDYFNVVGLPVSKLYETLKEFIKEI